MGKIAEATSLICISAGAVFGASLGVAGSMWGGIELILPLCVVLGVIAGWAVGKIVVSILRIR